jgi:hypothetical protein
MMIRLNEVEGHARHLLWCLRVGHQRKNFRGSALKFPMPLGEFRKEFRTSIYSQKLKQDFTEVCAFLIRNS